MSVEDCERAGVEGGNSGFVVVFHQDGRIEFGEKYRDNPDAAAQEFMRIVCEKWPHFISGRPV